MRTPTPRRTFLAQAAGAAAAACATPLAALADTPAAPGAPGASTPAGPDVFDDAWTARVRAARHRAVFDAPSIEDGLVLWQAWLFRRGCREALGAEGRDAVVPVLVLRHAATLMAFDDALWAKYDLGTQRKIDDPATKKPAVRNPWARTRADAPPGERDAVLGDEPAPTVEGMLASGAVVLTCGMAIRRFAQGLATRTKGDPEAVRQELQRGVVPGVLVQPSGIYATLRAQEAGCTFMRSTSD